MNKIKPLSEQLTNLIAAGEVVERPAGILKELIENSIDAQATRIEIEIKNGGLDLIHVQDNGIGMSKEDLPMAFKRHATSKIAEAADLSRISSLGFRGEALPSIASVSRVEIISKTKDAIGHRYHLVQGEEVVFEPTQANNGTTVRVSNLFYKQPARLKYLKHPRSEAAQCLSLVQSFALGNPEISFRYLVDEREIFQTSGSADL
ncbi:MAG TPA: DNA mismatch repair protein MutL, partial [Erysipelothrix sp.]|nr:DNA mismatch repair protein MutL [Erysipelothrix sp.]